MRILLDVYFQNKSYFTRKSKVVLRLAKGRLEGHKCTHKTNKPTGYRPINEFANTVYISTQSNPIRYVFDFQNRLVYIYIMFSLYMYV